jgi:hypothetical protein
MLAFDKDITRKNPQHPEEEKYPELKAYMDYQRKLDHQRIVYHALDRAKARLQENIQESMGDENKQNEYLQKEFLLTHDIADADTIIRMLRKLLNAHNATNSWYKMNSWHYALVYDCLNNFISFYNKMIEENPDEADELNISGGEEIDFPDWIELYFPDIDFHVGKPTSYGKYPLAKRNKAIEDDIDKKVKEGSSYEDALLSLKEEYSIEEASINFILGKKIHENDLELFFTSVENPIYDYLLEKQDGSGDKANGETFLDQAYGLGTQLKSRESDKTLN